MILSKTPRKWTVATVAFIMAFIVFVPAVEAWTQARSGYVGKDSQETAGPEYAFGGAWADIDIRGTGTSVAIADDSYSAEIGLGFTFDHMGVSQSKGRIHEYGTFTFGDAPMDPLWSWAKPLSDEDMARNAVHISTNEFMMVGRCAGSSVEYKTLPESSSGAGDRIFILQIDGAVVTNGGSSCNSPYGRLDAQLRIYEAFDTVEVHFKQFDNRWASNSGRYATVGIKGNDDTTYVQYAHTGTTVTQFADRAVQYRPDGMEPPTAPDNYVLNFNNDGGTLTVPAATGVLANDQQIGAAPIQAKYVAASLTGGSIAKADGSGAGSIDTDGGFRFTVPAVSNPCGTYTFQYQLTDAWNTAGYTAQTVTIDVQNCAPVAIDDAYAMSYMDTLSIGAPGVLGNDEGGQAPRFVQAATGTTSKGSSFSIDTDGSFSFTPPGELNATTDTFDYVVEDQNGKTDTGTVTITIGANPAPVAVSDAYFTPFEETLVVSAAAGVLANDNDDQGKMRAELVTDVSDGILTFAADGSFTYDPDLYSIATDTFTYRVTDGNTYSSTLSVTIDIGDDPAATANPDSYMVVYGTQLAIDAANGVLANDLDDHGQPLTAALAPGYEGGTTDQGGTIAMQSDGSFTYDPPGPTWVGTDTFQYVNNDGRTDSVPATVTIDVFNLRPTPYDDIYKVSFGTELVVPAPGVLVNDTDPEDDALQAELVGSPAAGDLVDFNADGSIRFDPLAMDDERTTFTYRVYDSHRYSLDAATVTLIVGPSDNQAPALADDTYATKYQQTLVVAPLDGVKANDVDSHGHDFEIITFDGATAEGGSVTLAADGSFVYTPANGFHGPDTFTYTATDGFDDSTPATVTIEVEENVAPIAVSDTYATGYGVTLAVPAPGVMDNDVDANDDTLEVTADVIDTLGGQVTLLADGSFTYVPDAFFDGPDSFDYTLTDGFVDVTGTVTINVALNIAPVAEDDAYSIGYRGSLAPSGGVLQNDVDAEGATMLVSLVSGPANAAPGSFSLPDTGLFTYQAKQGFSGTDSFTYEVTDGKDTDTATVTIQVADPLMPAAGIEMPALPYFDRKVLSFKDDSVSTSEPIVKWVWEMDVQAGLAPIELLSPADIIHSYDQPGIYEVRLTVTDAIDQTAVAVRTVYVDPYSGLHAEFIPMPASTKAGGLLQVRDIARTDGADIKTWTWDFGDGSLPVVTTKPGAIVDHIYSRPGIYTITLQVRDLDDYVGTGTQTVIIEESTIPIEELQLAPQSGHLAGTPMVARPRADAGADQTGAQGQTIILDGTASISANGRGLSYQWTQHSGATVALQGAHTAMPRFAAAPGEYTFSLVVFDGIVHSLPDTVNVSVEEDTTDQGPPTPPAPVVDSFTITEPRPGVYSFEPIGLRPGALVRWDFGDGATSFDPIAKHSYNGSGQFQVTLTVRDGNQESSHALALQADPVPPQSEAKFQAARVDASSKAVPITLVVLGSILALAGVGAWLFVAARR